MIIRHLIVATALVCAAQVAVAQPDQSVVPSVLNLPQMKGWHFAGNQPSPPGVMTQVWVPVGETPLAWSQMVVITVTRVTSPVDPKLMIDRLSARLRQACGGFNISLRQDATENDALAKPYLVSSALLDCEDPAANSDPQITLKKHEAIWAKAIQGNGLAFMVQRDWHGDEIGPETVLSSEAIKQQWQDWFSHVTITVMPQISR